MGLEKYAKGFFEKEMNREICMEKCSHCQSTNTVDIVVYQKYAANFSLPFYPTGKRVVSVCSHCKQFLELGEMTPQQKEQATILKSNTKTPLWTFSGLFIVLAVIIGIFLFTKNQKDKEPGLIVKPQIGDIYDLHLENKQYSVMKVINVKADTITVAENKYEVTRNKDLHKLDTDADSSFYLDEAYPLTISEIKEMYKNDEIISVHR
jgi:hypothetical protein